MTYNVFGGMLNPAQSNQSFTFRFFVIIFYSLLSYLRQLEGITFDTVKRDTHTYD